MKNCLLCGVGGQGTVLASRLIAHCAMVQGQFARTAETIGMAQRGGSVVSHVRIGDDVTSSLIPFGQAELLIAFEPCEAVRCLPFLADDAVVIVATRTIQPVTGALSGKTFDSAEMIDYLRAHAKTVITVDGDAIASEVGSPKVLNVALLGAASATGQLGITLAEIEAALAEKLPPKILAMNQKALALGAECVKES